MSLINTLINAWGDKMKLSEIQDEIRTIEVDIAAIVQANDPLGINSTRSILETVDLSEMMNSDPTPEQQAEYAIEMNKAISKAISDTHLKIMKRIMK